MGKIVVSWVMGLVERYLGLLTPAGGLLDESLCDHCGSLNCGERRGSMACRIS